MPEAPWARARSQGGRPEQAGGRKARIFLTWPSRGAELVDHTSPLKV
jgi:hypothetical protein